MNKSSDKPVIPRTVGQALDYAYHRLAGSGAYYGHGTDNPWDEAAQLVLSVAGLPVDADDSVLPYLFDSTAIACLNTLLQRRIEDRIPLPYLTGTAHFAGLSFRCDPRAIIPRSPLAELIQNAFKPWYAGPEPRRLLDLCSGSGCIGIASALYHPRLSVDLVELDAGAIALSVENIEMHGLQSRVTAVQSDLFVGVTGRRYDLIVSNPPYVDASDLATMPSEYHHEPSLALGSGEDGLDLTRQILARAQEFLEPQGLLVVEVGNSWQALEAQLPQLAFTWLEFERGGHGVFAITAMELQEYRARTG
jgi:ribosomal protein L3 glutamine methyltransferase